MGLKSVDESSVRPGPPLTFESILEPTKLSGAELRRSMSVVTGAWMFGSVWLAIISGAPFTLFAKHLGATQFQFGLLSALPFIASLLTLPASLLTERTGKRKRIFLWGLYIQRLLWVPIAILPLWIVWQFGLHTSPRAMTLFIVLVFIMYACNSIGTPAWISWMADIVPTRLRGKYFARRRQWGMVSSIPAALIVGWMLDYFLPHAQPMRTLQWCAAIFLVGSLFGFLDIFMFQWVPEIARPPQTGDKLIRSLRKPLHDKQFLWFGGFVATLVFAVSFMGQFVTLYLIEKVELKNASIQLMVLVASMVAQLLLLPVWGKAADRMGKRPLLALAGLGLVPVGLGWCFLSRENAWLGYLLTALGAALWTGVEIANFNLVLELSGTNEDGDGTGGSSSYVAINSVIINVAGALGGLSSGLIAQWLRDWEWSPIAGLKTFTFYDVLFVLSAFMRLASVVIFLPFIHEPKARPTGDALRFMTANIYNNLFNAILQPLRMVRLRKIDMQMKKIGAEERTTRRAA